MKKILILSSFLFFYAASCKNEDQKEAVSENDVDAARNFIQAALVGDYDKAKKFMLQDSINLDRMNMIQGAKLLPEEKKGLASASINIHNVERRNDSTTIIIYSNSYKKNWDTLRTLRTQGQWLVDFNYLFEHDLDTLSHPYIHKADSVK